MEGTTSAAALAGERRVEKEVFSQERAVNSDWKAGAGLTAAKSVETGTARTAGTLSPQREDLPDAASARATLGHALEATPSKPEERSPLQQQRKDRQRQYPSYPRQHIISRKPPPPGLADHAGLDGNEAYAAVEAAEHAARRAGPAGHAARRASTEGFIESGIDRDREQQLTEERESNFAAAAVLAALCTLLAMFLVGALVWVQVRECLQLGRSSQQKAQPTEAKQERGRNTSKKECFRMRKGRGWGQWLHERQSAVEFHKKSRSSTTETVSANNCGGDTATGGSWPAREEPNCGILRRVGAYALKQRIKAQGEVLYEGRKDDHSKYGRHGLIGEGGKAEAGRGVEKGGQEDSAYEQEMQRVNSETPGSNSEYDELTVGPLDSGECKTFGFKPSQDGEGATRHDCKVENALTAHISGSYCNFIQQQGHPPYGGRSYFEGRASHVTAINTSPSQSVFEPNRTRGRSSVCHTSPGAWNQEVRFREEGNLPSSSSTSAEDEVPNSVSPNKQEDEYLSTFVGASRRTNSTWFSGQARPVQPSPAVMFLQQQYENTCRDLFTRLGEVVAENPVSPQAFDLSDGNAGELEGACGVSSKTPKEHTSVYRFDRPVSLSEEAVTEAEQLLTLLGEMFADMKKDFKDNHPGNVTCMIRCCNRLLEKDGLMVLSRCTKVPRLMEKAQSVVEIVVPCIWSS